MAATAADRMVECLFEWGVDTVFGLPGDGINGIMESLRQCQDRIRFVQVRHEETAALMACGYVSGRLGGEPTSGCSKLGERTHPKLEVEHLLTGDVVCAKAEIVACDN
jgi:glyoxylate carboligase